MTTRALLGCIGLLALSACRVSGAGEVDGRRAYVQLMKQTTLVELEKARPNSVDLVEHAAGWAVFGDAGAVAFGAVPGVGFGVAHDVKTGAETYLRMKRPVPETGAPTFRLVLAFADATRFQAFAQGGGSFDGAPPAGVEVWQLYADGIAVEPDVAGVSFYADPDFK